MNKPPKVSPLDAHLGYWLRFVSNHVSHAFRAKLQARNVTAAEWVMLRQLYDADGVAPSELADQMGMTRGAISKLADRLVAKSLITRRTNKSDRRCQELALAPAGRVLVPRLSTLADQNEAEFFGDLEPAVRSLIENAMRTIVRRRGLRAVPVD
jgi:DNA-binding MarR family transcriptional regulator